MNAEEIMAKLGEIVAEEAADGLAAADWLDKLSIITRASDEFKVNLGLSAEFGSVEELAGLLSDAM